MTAQTARLAALTSPMTRLAAPAGRVLIASLFIVSGLNKLAGFEGTQGYMEALGVPGGLLPAVIALEIFAPLAVIVGFKARIAAFLLAGFSIVSALIFHADFSDQIQSLMFFKNIAIAGGFLMIVAHGPGAFSFDSDK